MLHNVDHVVIINLCAAMTALAALYLGVAPIYSRYLRRRTFWACAAVQKVNVALAQAPVRRAVAEWRQVAQPTRRVGLARWRAATAKILEARDARLTAAALDDRAGFRRTRVQLHAGLATLRAFASSSEFAAAEAVAAEAVATEAVKDAAATTQPIDWSQFWGLGHRTPPRQLSLLPTKDNGSQ
jgi:hypothetical protein